MQIIENPPREEWDELVQRPVQNLKKIKKQVEPILQKVKKKGDKALRKYAIRFDKVELEELLVTSEEFDEAEALVAEDLKRAILAAKDNITAFHSKQKEEFEPMDTMPGVTCWRKSVPIQKVGLYIPGGSAPLFSTVLMLGIPAKLAGCEDIIIATPPNKEGKIHPAILYTAHLVGIHTIVKAGGAQAIAAMAYGTDSVPQVYKIFGPGNQYVTAAKQLVARKGVAIDMPAGPSEVAVFADDTAEPAFVAADLLSQAEHGADSQVLLVSTSEKLLQRVEEELQNQLEKLPRRDIAEQALANSKFVFFEMRSHAIDLLNLYAPEHLIVSVKDAEKACEQIVNAGSVFIGNFTPESAGDYASGTNHTLPTNGYAKVYAGVSLDSFVKKITYQRISPEGLMNIGSVIETMAEAEELIAHKEAVSIRLAYLKENEADKGV